MTTHNLHLLESCDKILELKNGKLEEVYLQDNRILSMLDKKNKNTSVVSA